MWGFVLETKGSELGGQNGLAKSELKSWLNIDKNMSRFVLETKKSEVGWQGGPAESELKSWLNIDKNMWYLYWKLKDLN